MCLACTVEAVRRAQLCLIGDGSFALALPPALAVYGIVPQLAMKVMLDGLTIAAVTAALSALAIVFLKNGTLGDRRVVRAEWPAFFLVGLIVWVLVATDLWDRRAHVSFVSTAVRGVIPIEVPAFPGEVLSYHVAFDFLSANIMASTGLGPHGSIELAQALSILATLLAVRHLVEGAGKNAWLWLLPIVGLGPLALLTASVPVVDLTRHLLPPFTDPFKAVPPAVSGLFQPAFALGWGLCATILACLDRGTISSRLWIATLMIGLSETNIVFWGMSGLALATVAANEIRLSEKRPQGAALLLALCVVALLWRALGTFQARPGSIVFGGFFEDALFEGTVIFLSLPIVAVVLTLRRRPLDARNALVTALSAMTIVGSVIGCVFSYRHSWDIVKFLHVSNVTGGILLALHLKSTAPRLQAMVVTAFAGVGIFWLVRFGPLNGVAFSAYRGDPRDQLALAFADQLGALIPPRSCLWTPALALSNAGIQVPGDDPTHYVGLLPDVAVWLPKRAAWQRAFDELSKESILAFGCPYAFVPDPLLPPDQDGRLFSAFPPVGQMKIRGDRWTLYRLSEPQ